MNHLWVQADRFSRHVILSRKKTGTFKAKPSTESIAGPCNLLEIAPRLVDQTHKIEGA